MVYTLFSTLSNTTTKKVNTIPTSEFLLQKATLSIVIQGKMMIHQNDSCQGDRPTIFKMYVQI